MLETEKKVVFYGKSVIDGTVAESYSATINCEDPKEIKIVQVTADKDCFKANLKTCREDKQAFDAAAYALQDEMISSMESEG